MFKFIAGAALLALAACASPLNDAPAKSSAPAAAEGRGLAAAPVSLIKAKSISTGHYGIPAEDRTYTIHVQNLAYTKSVVIHQAQLDGTWTDIPAVYKSAAEPGYEIWTASFHWDLMYGVAAYPLADSFCVKYSVNGTTYWDNNGSKNYQLASNGGDFLAPGVNVSLDNVSTYQSYLDPTQQAFNGGLVLQNLGFTKTVNIVYTTDNWATSAAVAATYAPSYEPAYGNVISSPNSYGAEVWNWQLSVPVAKIAGFQYAIAYTVNGTTYWDNNYGKNFSK